MNEWMYVCISEWLDESSASVTELQVGYSEMIMTDK
jgi:hypothetical protein